MMKTLIITIKNFYTKIKNQVQIWWFFIYYMITRNLNITIYIFSLLLIMLNIIILFSIYIDTINLLYTIMLNLVYINLSFLDIPSPWELLEEIGIINNSKLIFSNFELFIDITESNSQTNGGIKLNNSISSNMNTDLFSNKKIEDFNSDKLNIDYLSLFFNKFFYMITPQNFNSSSFIPKYYLHAIEPVFIDENLFKCFYLNNSINKNIPIIVSNEWTLDNQLSSVLKELYSYQLQHEKFILIVNNIKNGTELFYPFEALEEFTIDIDLINILIGELKNQANNLIYAKLSKF